MILKIYLYGHPVLRTISEDITPDYPDLKTLVADMFETMHKSEGVGLAAPQVGLNDRIVVIDASPLGEEFPECAGRKFALINPQIEVLDGEPVARTEGCLSLPGLAEDVKRVEHIRLKWYDEDFNPHEEEMTGFLARIVQHECDHLEAKLFVDHLSPIRKQLNAARLRNVITGEARCQYPVVRAPKKKQHQRR